MSLHKIYYFRGRVIFRTLGLSLENKKKRAISEKRWRKCLKSAWSTPDILSERTDRFHSPIDTHTTAWLYIIMNWSTLCDFERTLYVINFFMVDPTRSSNVLLSLCSDNQFLFLFWIFLFQLLPKRIFSVLFMLLLLARPTRCHRSLIAIFVAHSLLVIVSPLLHIDGVGKINKIFIFDILQSSSICLTFGRHAVSKLIILYECVFLLPRDKFSFHSFCLNAYIQYFHSFCRRKWFHFLF